LLLDTDRNWVVEAEPTLAQMLASRWPGDARQVAPGVLILSALNQVGRVQVPVLGEVEFISGKTTEADFNELLRDLTEAASALPFSKTQASGLPFDRVITEQRPLLYHRFVYLRGALSEVTPAGDRLDLALSQIIQNPHRILVGADRTVPIEQAVAVGSKSLVHALATPSNWERAPAGSDLAIARALHGYLPTRIQEDYRHHLIDTAENRFILTFMDECLAVIRDVEAAAPNNWKGPARERVLADCNQMKTTLAPLRQHGMWREVRRMVFFPAGSTVLQRRYGYRDVLKHSISMRMSSQVAIDDEITRHILALKNIAELYELWCFFALGRAIRDVLGDPKPGAPVTHDQFEAKVRPKASFQWSDGTRLEYNRTFTQKTDPQSTSVQLRPDYTLFVPRGPGRGLHLFDAKFKLRSLPGTEDEDADEATFQRADIYKMHTYRDAIPDARSVWALYPGTETRFYRAHDAAPGEYDGVGAVPARVGDHRLQAAMSHLLRW
jgi:predicted component of viral defense system (DUF524 family)